MSRSLAAFYGKQAEEWAEENRGVACLNGTVDGEMIDGDMDVEVKGVVLSYPNGRVGRLRFWERQHQELRERKGVYLVIVYSVEAQEPVQYDRFVHWSSMEHIMQEEGYSWYRAAEHGMRSRQTQIPWRQFFPEISE